jgi:hypothetical protein
MERMVPVIHGRSSGRTGAGGERLSRVPISMVVIEEDHKSSMSRGMKFMRVGKTGWLTPEGVFHECNYGEHHILAYRFMENEELQKEQARARLENSIYQHSDEFLRRIKSYIPMGVEPGGGYSYLFLPICEKTYEPLVTDAQRRWFRDNIHLLTDHQRSEVLKWLEDLET